MPQDSSSAGLRWTRTSVLKVHRLLYADPQLRTTALNTSALKVWSLRTILNITFLKIYFD